MNGVFSSLWLVGKIGNNDDGEAEVDNALRDLQNSSYPAKVPNSIIVLLFFQNISPFLKEFPRYFALCLPNITQPRPKVFLVNGSIICSRGCTFDVILTSSAQ